MTVDEYVFEQTKGIVQSGPFAGMKLSRDVSWPSGAFAPMWLGCHEEELHEILNREIVRLQQLAAPRIVNLGCAEGYYAVGMAMRLPKAKVWIVDKEQKAIEIAASNADANNVESINAELAELDRLPSFGGLVCYASLEAAMEAPHLVISDCEGGEAEYLDPKRFPGLLKAHMLVELHGTHEVLLERWRDTHHIVAYREGPRNPNKFPMLVEKPSAFRWAAICENRPCLMAWFDMWPK